MGRIVQVLGYKNRKSYYDAKKKEERGEIESAVVLTCVKNFRINQPRVGTRKMYEDLKPELAKQGFKIGRDKVHKILKDEGLLIKKTKKYVTTTNSHHRFRKYRNLVKHIEITRPEQVFVCDITYIKVNGKYCYLFLITDAYSKRIMGWSFNRTMKVKDGLKAVRMANRNRIYKGEVIHHSDRGIQYCTPSYTDYITQRGMVPSMTEDLHVYENAVAERVNGILKNEFGLCWEFRNFREAIYHIERSIMIYNTQRRHYSISLLTPTFVHFNPGIKIKTYRSKKKYKQNS